MFLDDFQAPVWHSHFQVSLNGTRIPTWEEAVNALQQTGPIGKLVTLKLLPEYWPLLRSGTVKLLIDDPTTHAPDGYAIDFVRILVNPHPSKYAVTISGAVTDADKHTPISGATVNAALPTATTDSQGRYELKGVPAGLVAANASAPGYDPAVKTVDVIAGQNGHADFQLHRHGESAADLARSISETGSAAVYGLHFDTNSAALRPDSAPALAQILALINGKPGSRWIIAGHTDNQGGAALNQRLSQARAASVITWLTEHGIAAGRLTPKGYGPTRPVADNSTENGRALNRRVEIAPAP
jgi:outer membrane protein OmpA-like peptidoglycan-associated protein